MRITHVGYAVFFYNVFKWFSVTTGSFESDNSCGRSFSKFWINYGFNPNCFKIKMSVAIMNELQSFFSFFAGICKNDNKIVFIWFIIQEPVSHKRRSSSTRKRDEHFWFRIIYWLYFVFLTAHSTSFFNHQNILLLNPYRDDFRKIISSILLILYCILFLNFL